LCGTEITLTGKVKIGEVSKMADLVMGERWNTEDVLEMALGIRRALDSVIRKESPPSECGEFLEKGISFLDEVKGGEALISGSPEEADSFNGTFLPLCLATDVWIKIKNGTSSNGKQKKIGELLNGYKEKLQQISGEDSSNVEPKGLQGINSFFEALSKLLLQQADPMMKEYSQPYRYSQTYA
jgi:hypothetical protein